MTSGPPDDHDADPNQGSSQGASESRLSDSGRGSIANRRNLVRIAKGLIAIAVVIGLAWAGQAALNEWRAEREKIQIELAEVDRQIEQTVDLELREPLLSRREALRLSEPSIANLRWELIALACLLYAGGLLPSGCVLYGALRSLGEFPTIMTALAAQLVGHAGKYVPGKAMVIVLRAGALANDDIRTVPATISVFMETLLMMAVGAAVACAVVCWLPVPAWMMWSAIGVAVAATIPTLPPILTRVAAKVSKLSPSDLQRTGNSSYFFVTGWAWSLLSWILIGSSFMMLVVSIPSAAALPSLVSLWAVSTAAIALGVVIGFASLLPGGAGVRELVLTTILATSVGPSHALLAALAARLMFISVEAGCAGAAWWWLYRQRNQASKSS